MKTKYRIVKLGSGKYALQKSGVIAYAGGLFSAIPIPGFVNIDEFDDLDAAKEAAKELTQHEYIASITEIIEKYEA